MERGTEKYYENRYKDCISHLRSLYGKIQGSRVPTDSELIIEHIRRREKQILVHSYLYEILDESLISDEEWDDIAKELVMLIKKYPEEATATPYFDVFKDWTGDSASDLRWYYVNDIKTESAARKLLAYVKNKS